MKLNHKLFLFSSLLATSLSAQQELLLHQSPDLWHSSSLNPAYFPEDKRLAIGLPAFSLDAAHSGDITYEDIFRREGDRTVVDFTRVIDRLDPENDVHFDQRTETVSLGFKLPGTGLVLQASHAFRFHGSMNYPKALPEIIWRGNAPFIGQTVEIGPAANLSDWNEWSAGVSQGFGLVRIGARAKYLAGISSLQTDPDHRQASVHTDPDIYQLTLNSDYAFYSSSLVSAFDTSGLGFRIDLVDFDRKIVTKNSGFAFDLGVQAQLTERLTLQASVLDLGGRIKWKEEAFYFRSNGSYTYTGVDFPGSDIITGGDSLDFGNKLDTLNDLFRFNRTAREFTTELPLRLYAGASFKLSDSWRFGLGFFHQRTDQRKNTAVGASAHFRPFSWVTVGTMYSVNQRSASNLGLEIAVTPGPVQLYFVSDNVFNAFTPKGRAVANFRLGGSVVF